MSKPGAQQRTSMPHLQNKQPSVAKLRRPIEQLLPVPENLVRATAGSVSARIASRPSERMLIRPTIKGRKRANDQLDPDPWAANDAPPRKRAAMAASATPHQSLRDEPERGSDPKRCVPHDPPESPVAAGAMQKEGGGTTEAQEPDHDQSKEKKKRQETRQERATTTSAEANGAQADGSGAAKGTKTSKPGEQAAVKSTSRKRRPALMWKELASAPPTSIISVRDIADQIQSEFCCQCFGCTSDRSGQSTRRCCIAGNGATKTRPRTTFR